MSGAPTSFRAIDAHRSYSTNIDFTDAVREIWYYRSDLTGDEVFECFVAFGS